MVSGWAWRVCGGLVWRVIGLCGVLVCISLCQAHLSTTTQNSQVTGAAYRGIMVSTVLHKTVSNSI